MAVIGRQIVNLKYIVTSAGAEVPFKPSGSEAGLRSRGRSQNPGLEISHRVTHLLSLSLSLSLLPLFILRACLNRSWRVRSHFEAYDIGSQGTTMRFMQILPYSYSNPKSTVKMGFWPFSLENIDQSILP